MTQDLNLTQLSQRVAAIKERENEAIRFWKFHNMKCFTDIDAAEKDCRIESWLEKTTEDIQTAIMSQFGEQPQDLYRAVELSGAQAYYVLGYGIPLQGFPCYSSLWIRTPKPECLQQEHVHMLLSLVDAMTGIPYTSEVIIGAWKCTNYETTN